MQENDIILLLCKRFSGEISAEEAAQLDEWINLSPSNAALARQYQQIWEKADAKAPSGALDLDAEFQQVQARLRTTDAPAAKIIPIGSRLLRLAAALALLLTAVWGYRQWSGSTPVAAQTVVATGENRRLELPDGSQVWLRENSTLAYPAVFSQATRDVQLQGEAYFEIQHHAAQPFRVDLPGGGQVEVLGTQFNVRAPTADAESMVLVREGKVRFTPVKNQNGMVLQARDKAVFDRQTNQIRHSTVNTFNDLSWQTGGLEFVSTPLRDVIADVEKYYQVKIELRNPALASCLHTAPLTDQPVEQVLKSLSLTYQLRVDQPAPGVFILSGGSCGD
ncbi:MAG: FecR domain-containing protein [Saprospiraceae bacterium]|nr:FecR domain-containing protein [Saprospiraceae bacterium]